MDQSITRTQYNTDAIRKFKRMSAGAALVMLLLLLRGDRGGRGASVVSTRAQPSSTRRSSSPPSSRRSRRSRSRSGRSSKRTPCAAKGPIDPAASKTLNLTLSAGIKLRKLLLRPQQLRVLRRGARLAEQPRAALAGKRSFRRSA